MKPERSGGGWWRPLFPSGFSPVLLPALLGFLTVIFSPAATGQDIPGAEILARSYTGQFIVTGSSAKSPLQNLPAVATNTALIHLDPAPLAVSAERIKQSLYRLLAIPSVQDWRGEICLVLRPALWTDESVTVVARPDARGWSYSVQLPNVVAADRFLRGLTAVLLAEMAHRPDAGAGHSAEIPGWLLDGLCRQMQADELTDVIIPAPNQSPDRLRSPRLSTRDHEVDSLAETRRVLRRHPALTVDQLSWPTAAQQAGQDDGVYYASAHLFVMELLKLRDGPARVRRLLTGLPACYNWQTAFQNAFHDRFPHPLDVEKWWALTVVGTLANDPGPAWTPAESAGRLNDLLQAPVEIRLATNALPSHVAIPLQTAITKLTPAQQAVVLQTRLRDLRIARWRMSPACQSLTEDYCRVLEDYLGERFTPLPRQTTIKHPAQPAVRWQAGKTIKKLDALDARRRALELGTQTGHPTPYKN